MRFIGSAAALLCTLAFATSAARAGEPAAAGKQTDLVQATLLADVDAATPGGAFTLGVRLVMKPHWHTYWVNPGEAGDPTRIQMSGPKGFKFGAVQWPLPSKIDVPGGFSYGYENEVLLMVPVKVAKDVAVGGNATIEADVKWLSCSDTCIEGGAKLTIALPIRPDAKPADAKPANRELFDAWRAKLPVAMEQASKVLAKVEQAAGADGSPQPRLSVQWNDPPPKKVEWFPIGTRAVAIENVVVRQDGLATQIAYKTDVFQPDQLAAAGGRVQSVLVYEDAGGVRRGILINVNITKPR